MKRAFYFLTLLFAATCFVACNSDDKETDIRDKVVGTYSTSCATYIYKDEVMLPFLPKESGDALTVSKSGNNELICDDGMRFINIREAGNGVAFNIPSFVVDGHTLTGFNGFASSTENFHGLYTTADKKLVLYCKIALEDYVDDIFDNLDEDDAIAFLNIFDIEDILLIDSFFESSFLVFEFECVKK